MRSDRIWMPNAVDDMASPKPMMMAGLDAPAGELKSTGQDRPGRQDLREPEAEDVGAHRPEPRRLQLEPDDEQEEHDAELGDLRGCRSAPVMRRVTGPTTTPAAR